MKPSFSYHSGAFHQRTLTQLRWVAILGQYVSILVAYWGLHLEFHALAVATIVTIWLLVNLLQDIFFGEHLRLNAKVTFWLLCIDLVELAAVLDLTGGLNNPFVSLLIVPVILAASTLGRRALAGLITLAICAVIFLGWHADPVYYQGEKLDLPPLLALGVGIAMMVLILFLSYFSRRIAQDNDRIAQALFATEMALQREHRLSSLGALVAAYAHELGTPLATIRFAASDLMDKQLPEEAREDAALIRSEAKRSAEILQSMGARGKSDEFVRVLPMSVLIDEAAQPHIGRGKRVIFEVDDHADFYVRRNEAIIQGLRNLIQNAVDFARHDVLIELELEDDVARVRIEDDGRGFPSEFFGKLGEPYLKARNSDRRKSYNGMGLGVFIAKTLLQSTDAHLKFENIPAEQGEGASVLIEWPRKAIEVSKAEARAALGENQAIQ